ncbi:MAG: metallophosphoesterase family protein [Verrucomicrobia bacterium]|nr:metallophosphoesterase family protein [Verrucomicrobiota bacterium]MCH8526265.1 metallophosphatase family protein [Kiritimatiellia bacterium]
MKILFISDIHANIRCLEAVLKAERDADLIYCAGDLVDVGLHAREVVDCIRDRGIPCVRGNHDEKIVRYFRQGKASLTHPESFSELNAAQLDDDHIVYLENLPESIRFAHDGIDYFMIHRYQGYELIPSLYAFDAFRGDTAAEVPEAARAVVLGHTHHPALCYLDRDSFWMNPGSVGYNRPDDPSSATRYMTVVDGKVNFHSLMHPHSLERKQLGARFLELYPPRPTGESEGEKK